MDIEGRDDAVGAPPAGRQERAAAERAGMTSPDRVVDSIVRAIRAGVYGPSSHIARFGPRGWLSESRSRGSPHYRPARARRAYRRAPCRGAAPGGSFLGQIGIE